MKFLFVFIIGLIVFQLSLIKKVDACIFCIDSPSSESPSQSPSDSKDEIADPDEIGHGIIINDREALLMMEVHQLKREKEHLILVVKRLKQKLKEMGVE